MKTQENVSFKSLTTMEVGGPARYLTEVQSFDQAVEAIKFAAEKNLEIFILGGGSNVVASDQGFGGVVIRNRIGGLDIRSDGTVVVGAGEIWDDLVAAAIVKNLAGVECLSGIPGSVGGAVAQNIGAYGQAVASVIEQVKAIEVKSLRPVVFDSKDCQFAYRSSLFKKTPGQFFITEVTFKLIPNGTPALIYHDVKNYFGDQLPNLSELRQAVIQIRANKGYVIMPGFECYKSAGSFFKNPLVPKAQFEKLKGIVKPYEDQRKPWFWQQDGGVKIAAARLIQQAGFDKGYAEGNVGISPKHPLTIINRGQASAQDIKNFAAKIRNSVKLNFGLELEEEVLYVGKLASFDRKLTY